MSGKRLKYAPPTTAARTRAGVIGALVVASLLAGCGAQPGDIPYSATQADTPAASPEPTVAAPASAAPTAAPVAVQTVTAHNGLIAGRVFLDTDQRSSAIIALAADGSGERQLTRPAEDARDDRPDWSPDGTTIAFDRSDTNGTTGRIWTVSAGGENAHQIGPLCDPAAVDCPNESETSPAFSPDGRLIAFSRSWGTADADRIQYSDLYVMSPDGSNAQRLTFLTNDKPYSGLVTSPSWSPDGKQLTFEYRTSTTGQPANSRALFVVNADGTGLRQLTPWDLRAGERASWSPDGTQIIFTTFPAGTDAATGGGIYTVRPDGTAIGALTPAPSELAYGQAAYSPDGRSIVYAQAAAGANPELFTMNADGTNPVRVTSTDDRGESRPAWGPAVQ